MEALFATICLLVPFVVIGGGLLLMHNEDKLDIYFDKRRILKETGKKVVNVRKGMTPMGTLVVEYELEDGTKVHAYDDMQ